MRIALVSTSALPTPPKAYGGSELVVAELAEGLCALGHEVLAYVTGDSACAGQPISFHPSAVWPPDDEAEIAHARFAFEDIKRRAVDVVHVHHGAALPFSAGASAPCLMTVHHARDEALVAAYARYPETRFVAISDRQRALHPELAFAGVVHHGLDPTAYPLGSGRGGYAAFIGRFCVEKGVHAAIDAAGRAGVPLVLGGTPHEIDAAQTYFLTEVQPRIRSETANALWLGELGQSAKTSLLSDARALLFPIDWEEPFGLVMIEAMLMGTPVIAFPRGAVPEVVEEGVTGFIVRSVEEMAARLRQLDGFDRSHCRRRAVERWSTARMAEDYVALYRAAIRTSDTKGQSRPRGGVRDAA